jgi:hypothetical protein
MAASCAGLGEGAGAGELRQGRVAMATARQWSSAWGGDKASGNGGGLERKRESERRKKGEASPLEMRLILRVGPMYRTVHFRGSRRASFGDSLTSENTSQ